MDWNRLLDEAQHGRPRRPRPRRRAPVTPDHPPPPKPRGGRGRLPVQRYVAPPRVLPVLPMFGAGVERPCDPLTAQELEELIRVLGSRSRQQWHGSCQLLALVAILVGTRLPLKQVLQVRIQDLD
ncbi:MAG: hypothetical protein V3R80_13040, partial [Candidatus Tectomicrobia bacterium]